MKDLPAWQRWGGGKASLPTHLVGGGIEIHIAAKQPQGVAAENWLPINREDLGLDVIMRVYVPLLDKMKTWKAPKAEMIKQ